MGELAHRRDGEPHQLYGAVPVYCRSGTHMAKASQVTGPSSSCVLSLVSVACSPYNVGERLANKPNWAPKGSLDIDGSKRRRKERNFGKMNKKRHVISSNPRSARRNLTL